MAGPSCSLAATTPETIELARQIKIADVHMHLTPESSQALLEKMDKSGVGWGGAVGGLRPEGPMRVKSVLGKRYLVALGQAEYQAVLRDKGMRGLEDLSDPRFEALFETAEKLFFEKVVRIFGEIHISNVKSGLSSGFQVNTTFDVAVVQKMYEMANRHNGFVQIHTEGAENLGGIKKIARQYPKSTTIISHCLPFSSSGDIRQLFKELPNVVCELSATGPVHGNRRVFSASGPKTDWLDLMEEFPDRFMLGTDPCCGLAGQYDEMVRELRVSLLPHLRPETLRKVAYGNAARLFDLED